MKRLNASNKWNNRQTSELARAILALRTVAEAKKFLRDLLTEDELMEFGNRWLAARLLAQNVSYSTIRGKTGLSSATIARISAWLKTGLGGYRLMLKRQSHHHSSVPVGKRLC
ncbi:MAG: DNA-binding transcriptional regulator [Patescibacteria group bacterium]|nr:DNA-binding transcriptional regulator [Patescibacteria group bacterium]